VGLFPASWTETGSSLWVTVKVTNNADDFFHDIIYNILDNSDLALMKIFQIFVLQDEEVLPLTSAR